MNEAYTAGAAGQGQAIDAQDGALLGGASLGQARVPPDRLHETRSDPNALTHRDKRLIAISMMLPVFLGSVDQSIVHCRLSAATLVKCIIFRG